jgi:hypothetical protein
MNVFPIFGRELRCTSSICSFRQQRLFAAQIAAVCFAVFVLVDRWVGGINLTRLTMLGAFSGMIPFTLLIIALSHAGNLLSAERREGTLPLLFLTHLTGYDIAIGKLLQALFLELVSSLAIVPALTLPLLAIGFSLTEVSLLVLSYLNVVFFGLAVGLFGAVFGDSRIAASWCLLFLLPFIVYSTPLAMVLPTGGFGAWLARFQWLNPCDAVTHAQAAAAGMRPGAFWFSLLGSHTLGWLFLGLAGFFLPRAFLWQAGANAGKPAPAKWRIWKLRYPSFASRARLLDRNPFLWLASRDRLVAFQIWLWLLFLTAGWAWFAWFVWAVKGLNVTVVLVTAAAACWFLTLTSVVPAQAGRQLVADRLSGALEVMLCTPLGVTEISRGIWLSLARRFLGPVIAVLALSATLMIAGYITYGYGGMIDPQDRAQWLFSWSTGILLLPLSLIAMSWVTMRRSLFAHNLGHASGIAFVQIFGTLGVVHWTLIELGHSSNSFWMDATLMAAAVIILAAFTLHSRRAFLTKFRLSVSSPDSAALKSDFFSRPFCSVAGLLSVKFLRYARLKNPERDF